MRIQLATDLEEMPIEDASKQWSEELSPFVTVARIEVPAQAAWSEESIQTINERMSFSPWHGLAAHRPLGVSCVCANPPTRCLPASALPTMVVRCTSHAEIWAAGLSMAVSDRLRHTPENARQRWSLPVR